jgi:hypothetical protein
LGCSAEGWHKEKSRQVLKLGGLDASVWWSWRDLNPRPQAFFEQFYMCSRLV